MSEEDEIMSKQLPPHRVWRTMLQGAVANLQMAAGFHCVRLAAAWRNIKARALKRHSYAWRYETAEEGRRSRRVGISLRRSNNGWYVKPYRMNFGDGSLAIAVNMGRIELWLRIGFPNPTLAAKHRAELEDEFEALRAEWIKVNHGGMA